MSYYNFTRKIDHLNKIFILGLGKCGVAVIRISGPRAADAILNMTNLKQLPKPRKACLKKIIDPITKEQLDSGLLLWFPGEKSSLTLTTIHVSFGLFLNQLIF